MKNYYVLLISFLVLICSIVNIYAQEKPFKDNNVKKIKKYFEERDAFFEENYFSKGIDKLDMKGTGYYPYLRRRHDYEMHADYLGNLPYARRWDIFQKSRLNTLNKSNQIVTADWQQVGPQLNTWGGAMISIDFDPVDENTIYAGASEGGLWKTADLGLNWMPLTDDIPAIGVSSIAVNPQDANTILIGTGEGKAPGAFTFKPGIGVLKSINGGQTWSQTNFNYTTNAGVSTFDLAF